MTATLGIWTIARFAALAVLATETLFIYARMKEGGHDARSRRDDHVPGAVGARDGLRHDAGDHLVLARFAWAVTPAVMLAGLCLWCTIFVVR